MYISNNYMAYDTYQLFGLHDWLVGGLNPSEKDDFVSWDDEILNNVVKTIVNYPRFDGLYHPWFGDFLGDGWLLLKNML